MLPGGEFGPSQTISLHRINRSTEETQKIHPYAEWDSNTPSVCPRNSKEKRPKTSQSLWSVNCSLPRSEHTLSCRLFETLFTFMSNIFYFISYAIYYLKAYHNANRLEGLSFYIIKYSKYLKLFQRNSVNFICTHIFIAYLILYWTLFENIHIQTHTHTHTHICIYIYT